MKKISMFLMLLSFAKIGFTCTRLVYLGPENTVITARSMDWHRDMGTEIWIFPRGLKRDGAEGPKTIKWTSRYASIVSSAFGAVTTDGMNEKGLVANLLYLAEAQYPKPRKNDKRLPLSVAGWAQYVLDNFETVSQAVEALRKEPFYVVATNTPDGEAGTVHLSISDSSGDSAIFEYLDGKLVTHHGRNYQVMTNSPSYDQQLALDAYWKQIGGATMLPGTSRAADRFARASYYISIAPKTAHMHDAIAAVFSVIRNASTPMGVSVPGQPNIAPTLWRSVSDQKNKRYYFESTKSPYIFWVDLNADLEEGKTTRKLVLNQNSVYSANATDKFITSEPYKFLSL